MLCAIVARGSRKALTVAGKQRAQWAPDACVPVGACVSGVEVVAAVASDANAWHGGRALVSLAMVWPGLWGAMGMAQAPPAATRSSSTVMSIQRNRQAMGG